MNENKHVNNINSDEPIDPEYFIYEYIIINNYFRSRKSNLCASAILLVTFNSNSKICQAFVDQNDKPTSINYLIN